MRPWQALPCPALVHHVLLHCQHPSGKRFDTCNGPTSYQLPFRQSPRLKDMRHCPKADRLQNLLFGRCTKTSALCASRAQYAKCSADRTLIIHLPDNSCKRKNGFPDRGLAKGQPASTKILLVNEPRSSSLPPCCISAAI
jgi:hypothetical protein